MKQTIIPTVLIINNEIETAIETKDFIESELTIIEQTYLKKMIPYILYFNINKQPKFYVREKDEFVLLPYNRWSSNHILMVHYDEPIEKIIFTNNRIRCNNGCKNGCNNRCTIRLIIIDDLSFSGEHIINMIKKFLSINQNISHGTIIQRIRIFCYGMTWEAQSSIRSFMNEIADSFSISFSIHYCAIIPTVETLFPHTNDWTHFNTLMKKLAKDPLPERFTDLVKDNKKIARNYGLACTNYSQPQPFSGVPSLTKKLYPIDTTIRDSSINGLLYNHFEKNLQLSKNE